MNVDVSDYIKNLTFVIWQDDFDKNAAPKAEKQINSKNDLRDYMNNLTKIEYQALLRKNPSTPEYPTIESDFDCVFLQSNPKDQNESPSCKNETADSGYDICQYWQTCEFNARTGQECEIVASKVVALVIPIVILLLTTAVFAIYCFKKKADNAEKQNQAINYHLPVISNGESIRPNPDNSIVVNDSVLVDTTPG